MSAILLLVSLLAIAIACVASWARYERDSSERFDRLARLAGTGEAYDERPAPTRWERSVRERFAAVAIAIVLGALIGLSACSRSDEYQPVRPRPAPPAATPKVSRDQAVATFNRAMSKVFDNYNAALLSCESKPLLERTQCESKARAEHTRGQDEAIAKLKAVQ